MNFRTSLFTGILIILTTFSYSQARIGNFNLSAYKFNKLNKETIKKFTSKKTTFILPDLYSESEFNDIISEVWDVTPYQLVMQKDFNVSLINEEDGIGQFKNVGISKVKSNGTIINYSFHILDFHVVNSFRKKVKKGKAAWSSSKIGTIYFTPDIELRKQAGAFSKDIKGELINFKLGYLKNLLQFVNNSIKNEISTNLYDNFVKPELKNLRKTTLYIDKKFLENSYDPFLVSFKKPLKTEKMMKNYTYDYKVVEYKELENMILGSQKEDFYYLMYNQINSNKIITIINGKTGDIIYQKHTLVSYNIKPKDLKQLDKEIRKAK
ncbi:hypothetical protein NBT05_15510 [Aquimarina sp. ERC-38]|uniref:hypothetical protein n=1 Tax=Aquimarina sp. ERC-38 TaxID=2949996 RepID=UPI002245BFB6|nr:hypothetical protein [Aquimarina sp. ERC-38]UZO80350.1 hypothetical protein NBT05_15510 [Aquimarina sp. ERC-38]